jgi:5-methylthioadenosine/S-adenosylhomocysteine deaminase
MSDAQPSYIRIAGGQVLTFDGENRRIDHGEVWIREGKIVALGDDGAWTPPESEASIDTIKADGRIVMPGLINAHSHSYSALLKGTVDTQPLDIYMLNVIASSSGRSVREVYVSTMIDCLTMLRSGVTSVIDHFSQRPEMTVEAVSAALRGYDESGMRAVIAPMFGDLPYGETVPLARDGSAKPSAGGGPDPVRYFAVLDELLDLLPSHGDRFGLVMGVDGPQRCSRRLMEMTGDFAQRHGIGLHTHLLETKTQARMAPEGGFVRRMADLGMLNEKSSLVHFVWCSDEDVAAARDAGVTIIHAPSSNLHLGSGICPLHKLIDAGIPVALGSDGSNCGPPNMFEKLRLAATLARVTEPDFEHWITAPEMLRMSMTGGARALGKPGEVGVLAVDALADILVLDPARHEHRPMGDVWNHLLYYENGNSVEHVLVNGRHVVSDGRVLLFDEEAILAEGEELVAKARENRRPGDIASQYPHYRDMIVNTMRDDYPQERLARLK